MTHKRLLIPGFLISLSLVVGIYTIYAQKSPTGLIVHPSNFDLAATQDNKPITETVTLDNKTNQTQTIRVDIKNFTPSGEEGGVSLTTEDTTFSLAKWITVTPSLTTIPANGSKDFTFTIIPPANAEPGGHFGSIVFATIPPTNVKGNVGASLSEEVASLVLFKVPGNAEEKAFLDSFVTEKNFYEFGPVTFIYRVKNVGQVHIAPVGQIIVKGTFGDTYYVPLDPRNVLPNSIRKIPSIFGKKLLIGHYSAKLIATYGVKNEQLNGYTEFYAFPVQYGLIVGVVLLILFLLRKRLGKALKALITGK